MTPKKKKWKKNDEVWAKGIIPEEEADVIYSKSKKKNCGYNSLKPQIFTKTSIPGIVPGAGDTAVNQIKHSLCSHSSGIEL